MKTGANRWCTDAALMGAYGRLSARPNEHMTNMVHADDQLAICSILSAISGCDSHCDDMFNTLLQYIVVYYTLLYKLLYFNTSETAVCTGYAPVCTDWLQNQCKLHNCTEPASVQFKTAVQCKVWSNCDILELVRFPVCPKLGSKPN